MKLRQFFYLISISLTLLLTGCPIDSPMKMQVQITPEPIVGKEVTAIILLRSNEEAPNTKLEVNASDDVLFSTNKPEFDIPLPKDEWVEVKVPFTVSKEGVHRIGVYAFNSDKPGSTTGFGAGKTLYIRSGIREAIVSDKELTE